MGCHFDQNVKESLPLDIPPPIPVISSASSRHHDPLPVALETMLVKKQDFLPSFHIDPSHPSGRHQRLRFSEATHTILHTPSPSHSCDDDTPADATTAVSNESAVHDDTSADTTILWYTSADLDHWRVTARLHCRAMRSSSRHVVPGTCTLSVDPALRGLEQRACLERQRRRFLVTKCVLQQQRKRESTQLAKITRQFTQYATQLAVQEAAKDYAEAYISGDESPVIIGEQHPTTRTMDGSRAETTSAAATTCVSLTAEKRVLLQAYDDAKHQSKRPPPCR